MGRIVLNIMTLLIVGGTFIYGCYSYWRLCQRKYSICPFCGDIVAGKGPMVCLKCEAYMKQRGVKWIEAKGRLQADEEREKIEKQRGKEVVKKMRMKEGK